MDADRTLSARIPRALLTSVVVLLAALFALPVNAQDIKYSLINKVEKGKKPAFAVTANEPIRLIEIELEDEQGRKFTIKKKDLPVGREVLMPWQQPEGKSEYTGTMRIVAKTGRSHEQRLKFEAIVATPVMVNLDPDLSSLDKKQVAFRANAQVAYAEMTLYGDGGTIGEFKFDLSDKKKGDALILPWDTNKAITRIDVKVYDPASYWVSYELTPFMVDIPHEEVNFDTGKATFKPSEAAKLDRTYIKLKEEIEAHKQDLLIQLYIAGYTDTVGTRPSNITLSNRRAQAIASYFRKKGIRIPIYYQGFGEDVLWVKTDDNVDEGRNRRALYLLGNQRPPISDMIPRAEWKRLQ